ncbi:MAG: hypothetical protein ACOXZW_02310 [Bacilli bacterium]|jgi:hypothetical protein|nr:hypothetical protein [Bacilli bacterium]
MKLSENKEVVIIIGIMVLFAIIVITYSLLTGNIKPNLNKEPNNNHNNNSNDNNNNNNDLINGELREKYFICENKTANEVVYVATTCYIKINNTSYDEYTINLIQLNLDGEKADNINKVLKNDFERLINEVTFDKNNDKLSFQSITYNEFIYYNNKDIVTIILKYETAAAQQEHLFIPPYTVYNVDKQTGKIMTKDEVLKYSKVNINQQLGMVKSTIKHLYLEVFDYDLDHPEASEKINNYINKLNITNFDSAYINSKGELEVIIRLPMPDWPDLAPFPITIGPNYVGYKPEMPF